MPFGKQIVKKESASGCLSAVMNIIWIFTGGLMISLTHLIYAFICAITIIGIPFAKKHMELVSLSFTPFGKKIK